MKLIADDWEGLFINDLNEDYSRTKYFIELSEKYNFNLEELKEEWVIKEDEDYLYKYGHFPSKLSELKGNYND